MAVTLRFQSTGTIPGAGHPVTMQGQSLTLGRGAENDMVLPDPDRALSKRHCMIEDHNGKVVVIDISTNGTFLNYGKVPLGSSPTVLNDGDILSLGPYELLVDITGAGSLAGPDPSVDIPPLDTAGEMPSAASLLEAPGEGGDFLDDLLGGPAKPTGPGGVAREVLGDDGLLPPLGEDDLALPFNEPSRNSGQGASVPSHSAAQNDAFTPPSVSRSTAAIPDDWDDDFLSGIKEPTAPPVQPTPQDNPFDEPVIDAPVATAAPVTPMTAPSEAARAFLDALGISEGAIQDADMNTTMSRLGTVMKTMITGMREILMTRGDIKSEFRIEQTRISAGNNNPLKFSISPEQAIEAMVRPPSKGYLPADQAAEEALRDIKAHQVAVITGMEAALKGVLGKLDPAALEEKIQTSGGIGSLLKSKKARYWEIYEGLYSEISDQAENDFHELFSKEFARAYKEQLKALDMKKGTN